METLKVKTPAKLVYPHGGRLDSTILGTAATISRIVGSTLGPGGRPVLLERPEYGLPPTLTKDGVSVFRALGAQDALEHCIIESMRDVATRTVDEAGDGTTTATVLGEAMIRRTRAFCASHPDQSPQAVIAAIRSAAAQGAVTLRSLSRPTYLGTPDGDRLLHAVARISANGDVALADAVMRCFEICGDLGNVTIQEAAGNPSCYRAEKVEGYQLDIGYEDSCGRLAAAFVNNAETQQCILENPVFVLYFGRILDVQAVAPLLDRLQTTWDAGALKTPNVIVAATAWGDRAVEALAHNWAAPRSLNVYPLTIPLTALQNSQRQTLDDLAAVVMAKGTGPEPVAATVFDPNTAPLQDALFEQLGNLTLDRSAEDGAGTWIATGIRAVEVGRHRTVILGSAYEDYDAPLQARISQVEVQAKQAASTMDALWHRDRLAKLTNGIAQLTVVGASHGELKERRDRADDAVCAVRAAVRRTTPDAPPNGCLPGAGWGLLQLAARLVPGATASCSSGTAAMQWHGKMRSERRKPISASPSTKIEFVDPGANGEATRAVPGWCDGALHTRVVMDIDSADPVVAVLAPALLEPAVRIMENVGLSEQDTMHRLNAMMVAVPQDSPVVYDAATGQPVNAWDAGLVDSTPAVTEALRNAVSIALLGTLGGAVVAPRDAPSERTEARDAMEFERMSHFNPANDRP